MCVCVWACACMCMCVHAYVCVCIYSNIDIGYEIRYDISVGKIIVMWIIFRFIAHH